MATNTILKMMTNGLEDEDFLDIERENFKEFTTKAQKEFRNIPLDKIKKRGINDYSISDIEPLAKSIIDNGLQQHIVVRVDGDDYVLIAGERRVSAYRWIIDKYKSEGRNYDKYLTIPAEVYTTISRKQEEEIYRTTNDTQRNSSLFEKVYRLNPCDKFFYKQKDLDGFEKTDEPDVAKIADYFRLKSNEKRYQFKKSIDDLAKDVAEIGRRSDSETPFITQHSNTSSQVVTIRWNSPNVMNDYIRLKLAEQNSDINISLSIVRKYASWIAMTYKPIIREFILCENPPIAVMELANIYSQSKEEQLLTYQALKDGTYKTETKKEKEEVSKEITYETKFNSFIKDIESFTAKFDELDFVGHKKELTGNQKELLKDVQKLMKSISKMSEKPH